MMNERINIRLRDAMKAEGLTYLQLAEKVGCNLKTAQRWYYEGRVPHRSRAQRAADALAVPIEWLWPSLGAKGIGATSTDAGVEIALQLGPNTRITADGGGVDPPTLWLRTGAVGVSITPLAIIQGRPLDRGDLDTASNIVMAAADYRTAILTELTRAGVITIPGRRHRTRGPVDNLPPP